MRKYSALQKVMAVVLTLVMVIGLLPNITLPAVAAGDQAGLVVSNKVADPETLNNWTAYYGDASTLPNGGTGVSTWKAGGVWTDKSVFDSDTDITAAGLPASLDDDNAFLVSLSALASNQEIVGQSSAPTDTMLVLDLSQSMDNSGSVDDMIAAANDTLDTLLKMNVNNRVGVVLYSGNTNTSNPAYTSSATVILPLDRYTTTTTTTENGVVKYQYLSVSGNNDTTVSVAAGTRNSNNTRPTGAKNTIGGTYIQNGLFQAWEQFADMDDKGVVQSGTQMGVQRQPILILMSDGRPTLATEDYNNVGTSNSNYGNGAESSTTYETVFLTQLTAAWVKGAVKDHYNDTAVKFYTLGLSTGNDVYATNVLNPSGTTNEDVLNWWGNFQENSERTDGTVEVQEEVEGSGRPGRPGYVEGQDAWYLDYDNDGFATGVGRNYADGYWSAANVSEMIAKFQEIVDQIGLQSAYSATLVTSGEADLDGYITIEDELGAMMEVKDIKGILLGSTLFTGAELAKSMNEGLLGSSSNPQDYGNEFVRTVKERIGIEDTSVAQNLIRSAYHTDQLNYVSDTDYSNYIGWYGDANNSYLGFWEESYGYDMESAPADAVYINKSYGFLGGTAGTEDAADMMHVVVMVRTEITTGHQTVLFKVPSSLLPMVTYAVELEGNEMAEGADATLTVSETDPIRLLYEVGLPDDVNNVNLEQKVQEYLAKEGSNHIHTDANGNYVFYANSWDNNNDGVAPDISELTDAQKQTLTASVAESHFIPNTANERYYVLEDSTLYTYNGTSYVPVPAGAALDADNTTYYFARYIVTDDNNDGQAVVQIQYESLYPRTVDVDANFQDNQTTGYKEVKAGTIRQHLSELELAKSENATDTIEYSDSLWVYLPSDAASDYNVYSFLGNNGKLTVAPATGLEVTKNVTEYAEGDDAATKFEIVVTLSQAEANAVVTDANGDALPAGTWSTTDNQVFTLNLANGQTVYITGLTAGTTYTVAEKAYENYTTTYTGAAGTITAGTVLEAAVMNAAIKDGNLYITKEITSDHAIPDSIVNDQVFNITVNVGAALAGKSYAVDGAEGVTSVTVGADGSFALTIKARQTIQIQGLPAGTEAAVTEVLTDTQDGIFAVSYRSRNHTGDTADEDGQVTITAGENATVVVENEYTPASTTVDLDIAGTKNFAVQGDASVQPAGTFTFVVEQWDGQNWVEVSGKTAALDYAAGEGSSSKTFTIENVLSGITYTHAGVYTYQVREVIGTVENVTYDRTLYTFTVTVTDNGGQLTATVTDLNNTEITDGSYEVAFNNSLYNAPVSLDIVKEIINESGDPDVSKAGFAFTAVQTDEAWAPLTGDAASTITVYSDGQGEARVSAIYDAPGTFYYLLSETIPEGAVLNTTTGKYELNGWIYDNIQYQVTVTVAYEVVDGVETKNLVATITIGETPYGDNAEVSFTNVYDPEDVTVDLKTQPVLNKVLTGRDLAEGEITFAIFEDGKASHTSTQGAVAVGKNTAAANGTAATVALDPALTFTQVGKYQYDVVEILPEGAVLDQATGQYTYQGVTYDLTIYDLVVEVSLDVATGKLVAVHYFEDAVGNAVFQNTYTAQSTEVAIDGVKSIEVNSGVKTLAAGEFTFGLYENDVKIDETTNRANGTFAFNAIAYDADDVGKTFTYEVKEIVPEGATQNADGTYTLKGVTYSTASFTVTVTVKDDGKGNLYTEVVGNGKDTIQFVNEYDSNPVSVSIPGTKTLEGRSLADQEFQFAIYKSDATFTERTLLNDQIFNSTDAQNNITFDLGTLSLGYHYFVIKEVIPAEDARAVGIAYDAGEYHVTVQVIDVGEGQMSALVSTYHSGKPSEVNPAIAFNNLYTVGDDQIVIDGSKTLLGGKSLTDGEFSFALYEGTNELDVAEVNASGTFSFDPISYTAADVGKTFTYTVKEVIPTDAVDNGDGTWTKGQYIYDGTVFTVEVTVKDDVQDGVLEITKTVNGSESTAIAFENTFVPAPIQYPLQAKKEYDKGLDGNDFTFKLTSADNKTNVEQTKKNDANGDVKFDAITFSAAGEYKFKVEEIDKILGFISYSTAEYEVTVNVINTNGVLSVENVTVVKVKGAEDENNLTFVNNYVMDGEGEVTIRGTKTLIGDRTTVNAEEFEFGLYDADGELVERVKNDANGNFAFATLEFDESHTEVNGEKKYTYYVKEIPGDNARYTYDDTIYTVVVTVKDNDQGGITVTSEITGGVNDGNIVFENKYTNPTPVTYAPEAQKNYNRPLEGDEFTFKLEGEINGEKVEQTKKNQAGGKVVFDALSFPEAGTYTFTVKEIEKILGFIEYATEEYELIVQVVDTNGVLSLGTITVNGEEDGTIEFTNTYKMDGEGEVTIRGTKTLIGDRTTVNAEEFEFGLYDSEHNELQKVKNDANGNFAFATLEFDESHTEIDGEKQYTYYVKEIPGDNARYDYDETIYTVVVTVKDNDQGGITVTSEIIGGENDGNIVFENKYTNPTPVTYAPEAQKNYNRPLEGDEFTFKLEGEINGEKVEQTKKNQAGGKVVFDALSFPEAGTYTFTVKEIEKILGFIEYATEEYELIVQVVDTNGVLSLGTITVNGEEDGTIEFTNTYKMDGEGEVTIRGTKTLTGDRTTVNAGEFEFGLYDSEHNELQKVKNDANGNFAFATLEFDESHTEVNGEKKYTYYVKEIPGDNARYTYDDTIYTVVVTVKDNDQGGITVTSEIIGGENDGNIVFENKYTNPTPVTYAPEAQKNYNRPLEGDEFTFKLEGEINGEKVEQTKKNQAGGKVVFDALSFPEAGTYTFTVKEIEKILGFIEYATEEYELIVQVVDTNGVLSLGTITVNGEEDGTIEFTNTYKMDGEGEVTIRGTKTLTGDRTTVNAEEFEFGLYDADGELVERVKNDANGNFAFSKLTFDETDTTVNGEATVIYTVKEIPGEDPYITYDDAEYEVVITIRDNNEGGIAVSYTVNGEEDGAITFQNTFTEPDPVTVVIDVTKTVENKTKPGITAQDFEILLYEGDVQRASAKTSAAGKAGFQITYGLEDVGKTVTYKVMEKKGKVAGVTYDETVYAVKVTVAAKEDGTLYTIINEEEADSVAVSFKNIYEKPATPVTGDDAPVYLAGGLLLISAAAIVVLLMTKKQKKGGKYAN